MQALTLRTDNTLALPSQADFEHMLKVGGLLVKSNFLPTSVRTPEQAVVILLKARELGIPPLHGFALIHVINGKPTIASELMLSLIYQNCKGAKIEYPRYDDEAVTIRATRPGHAPAEFTFSMKDAAKIGLLSKDNWQKYPRAMLRSRCISEMARSVFPDAIMGCSYTPEELDAEVVLDTEGNTISVDPPKPQAPAPKAPETPVAPEPPAAETPPAKPHPFKVARRSPGATTAKAPVSGAGDPYNGSDGHQKHLHGLLLARGVPDDLWADIHKDMIGKKIDALPVVIKSVTDAFDAHLEQAAPENQSQDAAEGIFER